MAKVSGEREIGIQKGNLRKKAVDLVLRTSGDFDFFFFFLKPFLRAFLGLCFLFFLGFLSKSYLSGWRFRSIA